MIHLANTPVLETARLILRAPTAADWRPCHAFMVSPRSAFIRDNKVLEYGQIWRAFCHVVGMWVARGYGSFVVTAKGSDDAIGLVGPWNPIDWPEAEIGWTLWSEAHEGKGYASEAAQAAVAHVFRDLRWASAVSYIAPDNARSIALAERLGAVLDADAATPGTEPCLAYRHPAPVAA